MRFLENYFMFKNISIRLSKKQIFKYLLKEKNFYLFNNVELNNIKSDFII